METPKTVEPSSVKSFDLNFTIQKIPFFILIFLVAYVIIYAINAYRNRTKDEPGMKVECKGLAQFYNKACRRQFVDNIFNGKMKKYEEILKENTTIISSLKKDIVNIKGNFNNIYESIYESLNGIVQEIQYSIEKTKKIGKEIVQILTGLMGNFRFLVTMLTYLLSAANAVWKGPGGFMVRKFYKVIENKKNREARRKRIKARRAARRNK